MKILDRLPIGDEPATIVVGAEMITIKRFQIFAWVSIQSSSPFPALLDTGHSHRDGGNVLLHGRLRGHPHGGCRRLRPAIQALHASSFGVLRPLRAVLTESSPGTGR
jgi:hypothetical protein